MSYTDGTTRTNFKGVLGMASRGIIIISKSYVEEAADPNSRPGKELRAIQEFKPDLVLITFPEISEADHAIVLQWLSGCRILKDYRIPAGVAKDEWLKQNSEELGKLLKGETD